MRRNVNSRLVNLERNILETTSENCADLPPEVAFTRPFHYLATDALTGMTKGTVIHPHTVPLDTTEKAFLESFYLVRECFYRSNKINKVLMSHNQGMFYGHQMFTKQVFYQRYDTGEQLSLQEVEEIAQQDLRLCVVDAM